jgi:hypothetical protein
MRRWEKVGLVSVAFLTACGRVAIAPPQHEIATLLGSIQEANQKGEVGSVGGYLYLILPGPPIPLRDWPVTLIPLPPTLEAAVAQSKERFMKTGRVPLTADALRQARQPITDYINHLVATGHQDLIRTVKTETGIDPKFTVQDVPPGRWLLLAELPAKVSVLLWAVPVTLTKGEQTWQSLNDKSLWLEGFTP